MPTVRVKQFTSWSFTRYSDYVKCPLYAKLKHLDRLPEPKGAALDRGTAIHGMAERAVLDKGPLPDELKLFAKEFKVLRQHAKTVELEGSVTFRQDWSLTHAKDWTGAWLRVKMDAALQVQDTLGIIDHKTGKLRAEKNAEYALQLDLYATAGLAACPTAEYAVPQLWYLDEGVIWPPEPIVYARKELPRLKKQWEMRVMPMFRDTQFKPTPGAACRWCHYRKDNGGPCPF